MLLSFAASLRTLKALAVALVLLLLAAAMAAGFEAAGDGLITNKTLTSGAARILETLPASDRLLAFLQKRVLRQLDNANSYRDLGLAYLDKARETADPSYYLRAEAALHRALDLNPQDADALVAMGTLTLARHQFKDALELGERAKALAPRKAGVYGVLGDAFLELGRYDEGFDAIQRMVDLRPSLASYARVSYARELMGDVAGAEVAMQMAAEAGNPASENTTWARVYLGHLYFTYQADLPQAEREYRSALVLRPDYAPALSGLARIAAAQGNVQQAVTLSQRAAQLLPLPEHIILLGDLLRAGGFPHEAAQQDALVRALDQIAQSAGVDTDVESALFEADLGEDPAAAVEKARRGYAARPSIKAADMLAWALFDAGEVEEAARYSQEALRLGTPDPLFRYHAAKIALAKGDKDAARHHLAAVLQATPYFSIRYAEDAQRTLAALTTEVGP